MFFWAKIGGGGGGGGGGEGGEVGGEGEAETIVFFTPRDPFGRPTRLMVGGTGSGITLSASLDDPRELLSPFSGLLLFMFRLRGWW